MVYPNPFPNTPWKHFKQFIKANHAHHTLDITFTLGGGRQTLQTQKVTTQRVHYIYHRYVTNASPWCTCHRSQTTGSSHMPEFRFVDGI
jgi:hypothetical protein